MFTHQQCSRVSLTRCQSQTTHLSVQAMTAGSGFHTRRVGMG